MKLRKALLSDIDACAALFQSVFNNAPWHESWDNASASLRLSEIWQTPGFMGIVAYENEQLIGFILGYLESWNREKHYYLKEMCVATTYQKKGIGTLLIQTLRQNLNVNKVARIYLLTARESAAEQFYQKNGFYVSPKMIMMGHRLNSASEEKE